MKDLYNLIRYFLCLMIVCTHVTRSKEEDLSDCDCRQWNMVDLLKETDRQDDLHGEELQNWNAKGEKQRKEILTRVYSTSMKPTIQTTTEHTTIITRVPTVTPIFLSKVSPLVSLSSTTTAETLSEETEIFLSSSSVSSSAAASGSSTRSTSTTTTPSTTFALSSTTPSSYTVQTFPSSTFIQSTKKPSSGLTEVKLSTRVYSSTSKRPTRSYSSTQIFTRTPTMVVQTSPIFNENEISVEASSGENKSSKTKACLEFCRRVIRRPPDTIAQSHLDEGGKDYEFTIREVPISLNFTMTVTAYYAPALNDPSSAEYKTVVSELHEVLVPLYRSTPGFQELQIRKLREGSILCDYSVTFKLNGSITQIKEILRSLNDLKWESVALPSISGKIDVLKTKARQTEQIETASRQLDDLCSQYGSLCERYNKLCVLDEAMGVAKCVQKCNSTQIQSLMKTCAMNGSCVIRNGKPQYSCGSERPNGDSNESPSTVYRLPAVYLYIILGSFFGLLLVVLSGLTAYFLLHIRNAGIPKRNIKCERTKDIRISLIEELSSNLRKIKK